MKRPLIVLASALFFVQPLVSLDTNHPGGNRITVLDSPRYDRSDAGLPIDYALYRADVNGVVDDAANEISDLRR